MRASLLALVLAIVPSAIGCGDDIKFPDPTELPPPALNGVFPAKGFTDRTLRVEISGDGTAFDTASTVTFGAGITVNGAVEVSSTGTLFANITIAGDAALGKRDVTVTSGADSLVLTAAFEVQNPIEVLTTPNNLQGGIGQFILVNHDPEHPFLGDLEITAGNGVNFIVQDQGEFTASGLVLFDTDAVTGGVVIDDTLLDTVTSRGGEVAVTARAATALAVPGKGTLFEGSGTLTATATTALFSVTTQQALTRGTVTPDDLLDTNTPVVVWLPGGKWANARGFSFDDLIPTAENATLPMVVLAFDADGFLNLAPDNVAFDIEVDDQFHDLPGATTITEVENNNPFQQGGAAQATTAEHTLFTGTLADFNDFDFIAVTLTNGQSIRVTGTTGIFGVADTELIVIDETGEELLLDVDDNALFFEDGETGPLPAGNYFVVLTCSFFVATDPVNDPYEAAITIIDNINE